MATLSVADGNDKLGKNCLVLSRPVGDTCPHDCAYLGNGCYAEKTENFRPNVRAAGFRNLQLSDANRLRAVIMDAIKRKKMIRLHERGDFLHPESDA